MYRMTAASYSWKRGHRWDVGSAGEVYAVRHEHLSTVSCALIEEQTWWLMSQHMECCGAYKSDKAGWQTSGQWKSLSQNNKWWEIRPIIDLWSPYLHTHTHTWGYIYIRPHEKLFPHYFNFFLVLGNITFRKQKKIVLFSKILHFSI